ncbi:putative mitochondrial chaperone BCS1-B [Colletotrichum aenigma]|uniref:putative mitochondrial chaperone BCS1-B n=1 Tax=Colletotrichum aenigma TaxID=1215731 RepID=UPI001872CB13|nr:putative mitochondrial chaperone BCS1-B [Colletotrichum aenigma]KAF5521006.1 putative mitochondrial chaperone BCS1-B [Colletotrichum aenigma]
MSIAGYFGLDIYVLSLVGINDGRLSALFAELPQSCVVLLEDVDAVGTTRSRDADTDESDSGSEVSRSSSKPSGTLSLSGLLNVLDGVASQEGRVLITTTNHIEHLDDALIRPGRADKKIEFQLADADVIRKLFCTVFELSEEELSDAETQDKSNEEVRQLAAQFVAVVPELEFSPADILSFLLANRDSPSSALADAEGHLGLLRLAQERHVAWTASSFILPFKLPEEANSVSHFVARHEELGRLYNELKSTSERRTVILHGLGGIGKTQTTIAFAKKHRDDYSAVFWLDARDTTALKLSYQSLAQRIATETSSVTYIKNALSNRDLNETVSAVKRWLDEPKNNRWLMIYDNYDDVKLHTRRSPSENGTGLQVGNKNNAGETGSKAYDIRPFFPNTEHGAILITTRSSSVKLGQRVQLGKLADLEDSLAILASTSGRADLSKDPDATVLAKKLDGLPLALATAGAYLDQVATSCREYLEMYEKAWLHLQEESPGLTEYDYTLYTTWDISLRHIRLQNQNAADLLRL